MASQKWRSYHKNREITIKGKDREYSLEVTTGGKFYWTSDEGYRRLETLWQGKLGIMNVVLPDGITVQIKQDKEGKLYQKVTEEA